MSSVLKSGRALSVDIDSLMDSVTYEPDLKSIHQILYNGGLVHRPLNNVIDQLRWRKSEQEQKLMRETCRIGSESLNSLLRLLSAVRNSYSCFRECSGEVYESSVCMRCRTFISFILDCRFFGTAMSP